MQNLKNIFAGFLISFIGSIPLGYLNVVGFQVFERLGITATVWYLVGVIGVEFFVIYFTLVFAQKLSENKKLTQYIEGFSVVFMFVLAFIFYNSPNSNTKFSTSFQYSSFVLGVVLSVFNFIQIPFWTSWNLYLLNENYIEISNSRKYFYLLGSVIGTFLGMLTLILSLHYFTSNIDFIAKYLVKIIIPSIFLILGVFQTFKFYKKHFVTKTNS